MSAVEFGGRTLVVRRGRVSGRVPARTALVCALLVLAAGVVGLVALGVGTVTLSPAQVFWALFSADSPAADRLVVLQWRLPRYLFGVLAGAALGMSGAIFQSLTRNPLGSPDIIGFSTGSYTGALLVMLGLGSASYYAVGGGALAGGIVVAALVYALAWRGGVRPFRLIIVGIGMSAMLSSVNAYLLMRVSTQEAMLASVWAAGTLNALGYAQLWPAAGVFVVLCIAAGLVAAPLGQLEMGDDGAIALGVRAQRARAWATVVGVALTALVTAAAGPIAFIALAAPQIARRLTRGSGLHLVPAALTGAVLLSLADVAAQRVELPVGVLTVCVGGLYLTWLLMNEYRSGGRS